ncbi:MAG: glycerophosphodiester phosphodiesterase [Bradymonadia bacterium]
MEIWAHRGCHGYDKLLENTLPAFQRAIDDGVDGIELDVHISADGVPFVFHDDCLRRLSVGGRRAPVAALGMSDLRSVILQGGNTIPSLDEVLHLIGEKVAVNIELKNAAAVEPVATVLKRRRVENALISSFEPAAVRAASVILPQCERAWISGDVTGYVGRDLANWYPEDQLLSVKATRWHTHIRQARRALVMRLASRGIPTFVWTVNDTVTCRDLALRGVAGVFSDEPTRLRREFAGEPRG